MHSPLKSRRTGRAQSVPLTAVAALCAALWCGSSSAAPPAAATVQPTPTVPAPNAGAQANAGASSSGNASLRRMALGGVAAVGLWSIVRAHQVNQATQSSPAQASQPAQTSTPAGVQAGLPQHTGDNDDDRPIDMDGIDSVGDLDHYSIRRLMDTLRDLRARKAYDCAQGRAAIDYFCSKIHLVIRALGRKHVTEFGDQSHDGCSCR